MTSIHPVSVARHGDSHWRRFTDFRFAAADALCPLVTGELPLAVLSLPTAFVPREQGFTLVAMLGLEPGSNLMVNPQGKWRNAYLPDAYRCHPFLLAGDEDGEPLLCVDEDSGQIAQAGVDAPASEAFFAADGSLAPALQRVAAFLTENLARRRLTEQVCEQLQRRQLIEPWAPRVQVKDKVRQIEGLYRVGESRLQDLPGEVLAELRDSGALATAYAQLISMGHLGSLVELARGGVPSLPTRAESIARLFDQGGSISFDNI